MEGGKIELIFASGMNAEGNYIQQYWTTLATNNAKVAHTYVFV
jgi:hypothetical protein